MSYCETSNGFLVNLADPDPKTIHFADIARSLSRTARFNGHTKGVRPYTVAQHSVFVARAAQSYWGADNATALQALLHDAHEAYLGDIGSPVKDLPGLRGPLDSIAGKLQSAIHIALKVPAPDDAARDLIKRADLLALAVEAHHLMPSRGAGWACMKDVPEAAFDNVIRPVSEQHAFELFWLSFQYLSNDMPLEGLCA